MILDSDQLTILHEMGIPLWELRTDDLHDASAEPETISEERYQLATPWIILVDSLEVNSVEHNLLHAILRAIGLTDEQFSIISIADYARLQLSTDNQYLLCFGPDSLSTIDNQLDFSAIRGQVIQEERTVFATHALADLIKQPQLKGIVWQDLTKLQSHCNGAVSAG